MSNILLVAQHEFMTNIRKRSFLFAVFGVPIMMGVIFAITIFAQVSAIEGGIVAERIGYIDRINTIDIESERFVSYDDLDVATAALNNEEVDVFFVLTPLYISTGNVPLYSNGSVSDETRDDIEIYLVENLTAQIESDAPPERLIDPVDVNLYLESSQRELSFQGIIGLFITPVLFAIVLLMALQLSSTFLMSGIVEEKSNHIMEILITSITPYQLLSGKLLGLGALGLIQLLVWLILGAFALVFGNDIEILSAISLPIDFIIIVLIFFLLTYFLYASLLAGIGAIAGSEQESRTIAGVVSFLIAIPFFFFSLLLTDPNSPIFTFFTFFPFTAGMTYMMRFPFATIPFWQVGLSLGILAVSTLVVTWASAKVFRWALLLYGKRPNIMTILRVITGRQEIGVIPNYDSSQEQGA